MEDQRKPNTMDRTVDKTNKGVPNGIQIASLLGFLLPRRVIKNRARDDGVASLARLSIKSLSQVLFLYALTFLF
jgi:hypothetical protein